MILAESHCICRGLAWQLTGTLSLRSPRLASSPFAKHTQQPFVDNASCRSRLSDYGFSSESEDERDWHGCCGDDMEPPIKDQALPQDFGFWAEVGAVGVFLPAMVHLRSCLPGNHTQ